MAKKNNFYAVWRGRKTGIFDSWEECKAQVVGFEGAQYKGFPTREEAVAARSMGYWKSINQSKSPSAATALDASSSQSLPLNSTPIIPSIAVDAACSGNPGLMEYRGVFTSNAKEIFRLGPFKDGTNNIGEFLALVHGLALLKQNNSEMPIYSDSANAIAWVRKKRCNTRLARTENNIPIFDLISRAERWLQNNSYSTQIIKWPTDQWGEIPADFGRK